MAISLTTLSTLTFLLSSILPSQCQTFSRSLLPKQLGLKEEKLTHLHFYYHDNITGPSITAVRGAQAPTTATSPTLFGAVYIMDDPLTEGPNARSKLLGRAQGTYVISSLEEGSFLMVWNYVFLEGEYNGSTMCIMGRNPIFHKVREMSVVGGSGVFRFARGYVQLKTHSFNQTSGNAIMEYDVYVFHY